MVNETDLTEEALGAVRQHLSREGVVLAYLFGSVARGDAGPLSDVDLAVLYRDEMPPAEAQMAGGRLADELQGLLGRGVDVVVLNLPSPALHYAIIDEGKVILNTDEDRRVQFEARTMMEYLDTEHMRAVQRLYLYERIEERARGRSA